MARISARGIRSSLHALVVCLALRVACALVRKILALAGKMTHLALREIVPGLIAALHARTLLFGLLVDRARIDVVIVAAQTLHLVGAEGVPFAATPRCDRAEPSGEKHDALQPTPTHLRCEPPRRG